MDSKTKARRGLIVFFVVLIAGSAYFEHKILVLGGSIEHHLGLIIALMWWVAVSSIRQHNTAGRMMMQRVGAFAEFERAMLRERTKAGLDSARREGRMADADQS